MTARLLAVAALTLAVGACTFPTEMKLESATAQDADNMIIEVSSSDDWLARSKGFWGGEPYLVAGICGSESHTVSSYLEREVLAKNGRHHYTMSLGRNLDQLRRSDPLPGGGWVRARGWPRDLLDEQGLCVSFDIGGMGYAHKSAVLRMPEAEKLFR